MSTAPPNAPTPTRAQENQTLTLPDSRTLGFAEFGAPTGYPVVFFHGYPSSRLEAAALHALAARRGLRVLALDRPGFGLSTFQPGRRIADYPADVAAFAAHLGLGRFAVLGGSGGGPYALACAAQLPRGSLSAVGLLASAGPWDGVLAREMSWARRVARGWARWAPGSMRVVTDLLVGGLRWVVRRGVAIRWIDGWLEAVNKKAKETKEAKRKEAGLEAKGVAEAEEPVRTVAEQRERLLQVGFEGFAQGARAAVQETQLLTENWGIRLEDIAYDPILIWHGTKDVSSPITPIRYMASRIPHSDLREFPDDTHFTMGEHLEKIISELVPEESEQR